MADAVLTVEDLRVAFPSDNGLVEAVRGVSFALGAERVALVGESGSGKTMTARALLGLQPPTATVTAQRMSLGDTDLRGLTERQWTRLRGDRIGLVLQDPRYALNPLHRVGRQVEEALLLHTRLGRAERRERALQALADVGLDDPKRVYMSYPSELSGGMGQRAAIAGVLVNRPALVVADEPTSALDREHGDRVLDLLGRLAAEQGTALLLISHDLRQVARATERVLVMYRGRIVDERPSATLAESDEPYTQALWRARPSAATHGTRLPVYAPIGPP